MGLDERLKQRDPAFRVVPGVPWLAVGRDGRLQTLGHDDLAPRWDDAGRQPSGGMARLNKPKPAAAVLSALGIDHGPKSVRWPIGDLIRHAWGDAPACLRKNPHKGLVDNSTVV